jgi:hypothetical protein
MIRPLLLASVLITAPLLSPACDCAMELPGTFCETLDPDWAEPHGVVLGVKLNEVYYGMRVKVVEVFSGNITVGDTLTVWGDNGALCRWYVGAWNNGDTVLWGLHETDFLGNEISAGFPPDLEQPGDYIISNCGTYWLSYASGMITGGVAPGITSISVEAFWPAMAGCTTTSVPELNGEDPLRVRTAHDGVWLSLDTPRRARLVVMDEQGRAVVDQQWDGSPMPLRGFAPSLYVVQVSAGEHQWIRKFTVR